MSENSDIDEFFEDFTVRHCSEDHLTELIRRIIEDDQSGISTDKVIWAHIHTQKVPVETYELLDDQAIVRVPISRAYDVIDTASVIVGTNKFADHSFTFEVGFGPFEAVKLLPMVNVRFHGVYLRITFPAKYVGGLEFTISSIRGVIENTNRKSLARNGFQRLYNGMYHSDIHFNHPLRRTFVVNDALELTASLLRTSCITRIKSDSEYTITINGLLVPKETTILPVGMNDYININFSGTGPHEISFTEVDADLDADAPIHITGTDLYVHNKIIVAGLLKEHDRVYSIEDRLI